MLTKVQKDGDTRLCESHQVERFVNDGWEIVPQDSKSESASGAKKPKERKDALSIKLHRMVNDKGGEVLCESHQIARLSKSGWRLAKGDENGEEQANHDSGVDEGRSASESEVPEEGRSGTDGGSTGRSSGSEGSESTSHDEQAEGGEDLAQDGENEVANALLKLDHDNDEHWTQYGAPRVDVVAELLGRDTSRSEITKAIPDFIRKV